MIASTIIDKIFQISTKITAIKFETITIIMISFQIDPPFLYPFRLPFLNSLHFNQKPFPLFSFLNLREEEELNWLLWDSLCLATRYSTAISGISTFIF